MVKVQFFGLMRHYTETSEVEVEAKKINDLLKIIELKYGKDALKEAKRSFILVNGDNVALLKGHRTKLNECDLVQIITISGGG